MALELPAGQRTANCRLPGRLSSRSHRQRAADLGGIRCTRRACVLVLSEYTGAECCSSITAGVVELICEPERGREDCLPARELSVDVPLGPQPGESEDDYRGG